MTLSLSEKKLIRIIQLCPEVYSQPKTSVFNLTELIGLPPSTVQSLLPAKIQSRFPQQEQILGQ